METEGSLPCSRECQFRDSQYRMLSESVW